MSRKSRIEKNKYYSELLDAAGLEDLLEDPEEGEEEAIEEGIEEDPEVTEPEENPEGKIQEASTEEESSGPEITGTEDPEVLERTVKEVIFLIAVLTLVEILLTLILIGKRDFSFGGLKLSVALGLLFGGAFGIGLFLIMKKQIEQIVELPAKNAQSKLRLGAILRIIAVAAVAVAFAFLKWISPLGFQVGLLNLKFAAQLAPLLDKHLKSV